MMNIFIADDNLVMRNLIKFYLKKFKYIKVNEAGDGLEALKFIKSNEIDILFLDLQMPNIDGFNVAKYLHESESKTHIIAISANINKENMKIFKSFGVKYFLNKPLDPKAFEDVLRKVIKIIKSK